MQTLLAELRSALEYEIALQGPYLDLGERPAHEPKPVPPAAKEQTTAPIAPPATPSRPSKAASTAAQPVAQDTATAQPNAEGPADSPDSTMPSYDLFGNAVEAPETPRSPYERIAALIPEDSPLHAMQTLEEVEAYTTNNILIPLDEQRKNAVFGVGNPNANRKTSHIIRMTPIGHGVGY